MKETKKTDIKIWVGAIVMLLWVALMVASNKSDEVYVENLETIIDISEAPIREEKLVEMYGEPDVEESDKYTYYLEDGEFVFYFTNLYVEKMYYTPKEPIAYRKRQEELFYMLGVGGDDFKFNLIKPEQDPDENYESYKCLNSNYIAYVDIAEINREEKTVGSLSVWFYEQEPDVEVFDADYSDTEVVFEAFQLFECTKEDVYNKLGEPSEADDTVWYYYTDFGWVRLIMTSYGKVRKVDLYFEDGKSYENSPQEALVMAGIDPKSTDIVVPDVSNDSEFYEKANGKYRIAVYDIDRNKKTFKQVGMTKDGM